MIFDRYLVPWSVQVGSGLFHIQHSPHTWIAESFASSCWFCATAGKIAGTEVDKGAFQEQQKQTTHPSLVHNHEELVVLNGIKRRWYWKMTWLLAQTCLIV